MYPVGALVTLCSIVTWQSMRNYCMYKIGDSIASVLLPSFKNSIQIQVDLTDLGCTDYGTDTAFICV